MFKKVYVLLLFFIFDVVNNFNVILSALSTLKPMSVCLSSRKELYTWYNAVYKSYLICVVVNIVIDEVDTLYTIYRSRQLQIGIQKLKIAIDHTIPVNWNSSY